MGSKSTNSEQQHVEEVAGQQQCGDPATVPGLDASATSQYKRCGRPPKSKCGDPATVPELDASATSQSKRRGRPPKSAISNTPAPESG